MKLINPTDEQINAAFAEKVAGQLPMRSSGYFTLPNVRGFWPAEKYTQSADAVLPWLEKMHSWELGYGPQGKERYRVEVFAEWTGRGSGIGRAATFPRAAVIALLRAHGVEVEFTH